MIFVLLQLEEIVPTSLNASLPEIVYFTNSTEKFAELEAQQKEFPDWKFYYLNATLHDNFTKNASIPVPSIVISTALGVEVALEVKSIPTILLYANVKPEFEDQAFFVSDEEDMVLAAESFNNEVIFYYVQKTCSNCEYQLLQLLQIAHYLQKKVLFVNCDGTRDLELACSRRVIRGFPWIEVPHNGSLYPINELPTADVFATWANMLIEGKFEGKGEPFDREWFSEHKTKYDADGRPLEFPVKPDVIGLEEKMKALELRTEKLYSRA